MDENIIQIGTFKVALTDGGVYAPQTSYEHLDIVTHGGSTYMARKDIDKTNAAAVLPTAGEQANEYWLRLADKGEAANSSDIAAAVSNYLNEHTASSTNAVAISAFNSQSSYSPGNLVWKDGVWVCNTSCSASTWANNSANFSKLTLAQAWPIIDDTLNIPSAAAQAKKTGELIAPYHSATTTYYKDSFVNYNGQLYKNNTDLAAAEWSYQLTDTENETRLDKWNQTSLANIVSGNNYKIDYNIKNYANEYSYIAKYFYFGTSGANLNHFSISTASNVNKRPFILVYSLAAGYYIINKTSNTTIKVAYGPDAIPTSGSSGTTTSNVIQRNRENSDDIFFYLPKDNYLYIQPFVTGANDDKTVTSLDLPNIISSLIIINYNQINPTVDNFTDALKYYHKEIKKPTDFEVYLPCNDTPATPDRYLKNGNLIQINSPNGTFSSVSNRFPLTGNISAQDFTSGSIITNDFTAWDTDIPDFIIGHTYKFDIKLISGSINPEDCLEFGIKVIDPNASSGFSMKFAYGRNYPKEWYCDLKPSTIVIQTNRAEIGFNNCIYYISIVDLTLLNNNIYNKNTIYSSNIINVQNLLDREKKSSQFNLLINTLVQQCHNTKSIKEITEVPLLYSNSDEVINIFDYNFINGNISDVGEPSSGGDWQYTNDYIKITPNTPYGFIFDFTRTSANRMIFFAYYHKENNNTYTFLQRNNVVNNNNISSINAERYIKTFTFPESVEVNGEEITVTHIRVLCKTTVKYCQMIKDCTEFKLELGEAWDNYFDTVKINGNYLTDGQKTYYKKFRPVSGIIDFKDHSITITDVAIQSFKLDWGDPITKDNYNYYASELPALVLNKVNADNNYAAPTLIAMGYTAPKPNNPSQTQTFSYTINPIDNKVASDGINNRCIQFGAAASTRNTIYIRNDDHDFTKDTSDGGYPFYIGFSLKTPIKLAKLEPSKNIPSLAKLIISTGSIIIQDYDQSPTVASDEQLKFYCNDFGNFTDVPMDCNLTESGFYQITADSCNNNFYLDIKNNYNEVIRKIYCDQTRAINTLINLTDDEITNGANLSIYQPGTNDFHIKNLQIKKISNNKATEIKNETISNNYHELPKNPYYFPMRSYNGKTGDVPSRTLNDNFKEVISTTHIHTKSDGDMQIIENCYDHVALSNYYPSAPYYPFDNFFCVGTVLAKDNLLSSNDNWIEGEYYYTVDNLNLEEEIKSSDALKRLDTFIEIDCSKKYKFQITRNQLSNHYMRIHEYDSNKNFIKEFYTSVNALEINYIYKPSSQNVKYIRFSIPLNNIVAVFGIPTPNLLFSPNSEHANFKNIPKVAPNLDSSKYGSLHICSVGSFYSDDANTLPMELPTVMNKIIDQLQFSQCGGITINHPIFTQMSSQDLIDVIDHTYGAFAFEVFHSGADEAALPAICTGESPTIEINEETQNSYNNYWNEILSTGRQIFGVAVPDHSIDSRGYEYGIENKNVDSVTHKYVYKKPFGYCHCLVRGKTEQEILSAYANGRFYISDYWFKPSKLNPQPNNLLFTQLFFCEVNGRNYSSGKSDEQIMSAGLENLIDHSNRPLQGQPSCFANTFYVETNKPAIITFKTAIRTESFGTAQNGVTYAVLNVTKDDIFVRVEAEAPLTGLPYLNNTIKNETATAISQGQTQIVGEDGNDPENSEITVLLNTDTGLPAPITVTQHLWSNAVMLI